MYMRWSPGVAAAFGEKVKPHPILVKLIGGYFKTDDLSSPAMKMAHVGFERFQYYSKPEDILWISESRELQIMNIVLKGVNIQ